MTHTFPKMSIRTNILFCVVFLAIFGTFLAFQKTLATSTSTSVDATISATSSTPGGSTNWTISFSAPASMASGSVLRFSFPGKWSGSQQEYFNLSNAIVTSGNGSFTYDEWGSFAFTTSQAYASGATVTISLSGVVNVSAEGSYQFWGSFDSYDSNGNWAAYYSITTNSLIVGTTALQGRVVDSSSNGVSGVYVNVMCTNGDWAYTSTDTSGNFAVSGVSGSCTISFSYWGEGSYEAPAQTTLTLPIQGTQTFTMLSPNVSFTLKTATGQPVSGAWCWVYNSNWSYYNWFSTDTNGSGSLAVSTAGTYTLECDISGTQYAAEYGSQYSTSFTYDGSTDNLPSTLTLTTPNLAVTVLKPNNTAAPDWTYVYCYNSSYSVFKWGSTIGGLVKFSVENGSYQCEVDWIGWDSTDATAAYITPDPQSVSVTTGQTASVTLTLQTANNTITALVRGVQSSTSGWGDDAYSYDDWETYENDADGDGQPGSAQPSTEPSTEPETGTEPGTGSGSESGDRGHASADLVPISVYYYCWTNDGKNWMWGSTSTDGLMNLKVGQGTYNCKFEDFNWPRSNFFTDTYRAQFSDNSGTTYDVGTVNAVQADATINVSISNSTGCGGGALQSGAGVGVFSDYVWEWSEVSSGVARVKVPGGTYQVEAYTYGTDCDQGGAVPERVTVESGGSVAVNMTLLDRNSTITGQVADADGTGLGCQYVWAWRSDYGDWADAQTDTDGTYSLKGTAGTWNVMSYPSGIAEGNCSSAATGSNTGTGTGTGTIAGFAAQGPMGNTGMSSGNGTGITYVSLEGTQNVTVADNATASDINFTYMVADKKVSGFLRYYDGHENAGAVAPNGNGFITMGSSAGGRTSDMWSNSLWGWMTNSQFEIMVPSLENVNLQAYLDWGAEYTVMATGLEGSYENQTFNTSSDVTNAAIYVLPNDATISGTIEGFSATAGFYAEVCADNGSGGYACTYTFGDSYALSVAAGTWTVTYNIPEGFGVFPIPTSDNNVTVASQGSATVNFTVVEADATITGTVTQPDGTAVTDAAVVIASGDITTVEEVDANGTFSVSVPADNYAVYYYLPEDSEYIGPAYDEVSVATEGVAEVSAEVRESDAVITGAVELDDTAVGGFVAAYTADGAVSNCEADSTGVYSCPVFQGEDWTVRVTYDDDDNGVGYDSGAVVVTVDEASEDYDLEFNSTSTAALSIAGLTTITARTSQATTSNLPAAQRKSFSSSTQAVINFSDGAKFVMPAYSLKNSSDTMSVIITPKSEIPSASTHEVLTYGYLVEALDSNNAAISTLAASAAVTLSYSEAQLTNLGLTEDDITLSRYDGTSWKDVTGAVVNKSANTVSANVTQFDTFAVTSSARSVAADVVDDGVSDGDDDDATSGSLAKPANVRIKNNSRTARSFIVKWDAVDSATEYQVQLWDGSGKDKIKSYTVTATQKKIVKQTANTKYKVRVRATNNATNSAWSGYKGVRTKPAAPQSLHISQKLISATGDGSASFMFRFKQAQNRKNLKAVMKVVTKDDQQINFKFGKKDYKSAQSFILNKKKQIQTKTITVESGYVGAPLRVMVQVKNTNTPKTNKTKWQESRLFTISE